MIDLLIPVAIAITGLFASWLKCFENGKPNNSGWIIISLLIGLTVISSINSNNQKKKYDLERQKLFSELDSISKSNLEIKESNNKLHILAYQTNKKLSEKESKLPEQSYRKINELIENRKSSNIVLEKDMIYKYSNSLELRTLNGGPETLLPCCDKILILKPMKAFLVEGAVYLDGVKHFIINFHTKNTNSDIDMGWQSRALSSLLLDSANLVTGTTNEYLKL